MTWHQLSLEDLFVALRTTPRGLNTEEVKLRRDTYGLNELTEKQKKPAWKLFLLQFKDVMIVILLLAAVIAGLLGEIVDMGVIILIVTLNAVIGFIQEYRAEKTLEALKKMSVVMASVVRDEKMMIVPSPDLVPGDVIHLEAGASIPADIRILTAHQLQVNESALTGESLPVEKHSGVISEADVSLGDRLNMAYKGTVVIKGRGVGVVVATGMKTEIGKIASLLEVDETATPLKKRMADFGTTLSYIIIGICVLLFVVGLLKGERPLEMLLLAVSLAVAAIPEALPALITIALSLGAKRMMIRKALIRKLPAVETLGAVSFVCSDKTGTLTLNRMTVEAQHPIDQDFSLLGYSSLELGMLLNHDTRVIDGSVVGDPTEVAIAQHYLQWPSSPHEEVFLQLPRVAEWPFDAVRKCMTTAHAFSGGVLIICKGAEESIQARLAKPSDELHEVATRWSSEGMRVICFAYKIMDAIHSDIDVASVESGLVATGAVAMIDPPRNEVISSIHRCEQAGIKTVMITGDHLLTARTIAERIGILSKGQQATDGQELAKLSEEALDQQVENIRVYARVTPEQKLDIVRSLQRKGFYVAMTGDGVNDAPSLKAADIGVAMGINGTDVSKEAADMILLDDNFSTIVAAIEEGRRIYDNIRKFVRYIMTCNSAEIWTIFLAPLLGLPMPLLPIHILWINLVTDGLPGLALANEPAEKNIMERPPRNAKENLFARGVGAHIIWVGMLMAALTLGIQAWAVHANNDHWQTMVFTVLSLSQLAHVLAIRSEHQYLFRHGLLNNLPMTGAVVMTFALQMAVIYLPFANTVLKTSPLTMVELSICLGAAVVLFHAVELEKPIRKYLKFT
ncbi:MAG: cation-translocating P-type ATPase [Chitinophagaceae bacterium]